MWIWQLQGHYTPNSFNTPVLSSLIKQEEELTLCCITTPTMLSIYIWWNLLGIFFIKETKTWYQSHSMRMHCTLLNLVFNSYTNAWHHVRILSTPIRLLPLHPRGGPTWGSQSRLKYGDTYLVLTIIPSWGSEVTNHFLFRQLWRST